MARGILGIEERCRCKLKQMGCRKQLY